MVLLGLCDCGVTCPSTLISPVDSVTLGVPPGMCVHAFVPVKHTHRHKPFGKAFVELHGVVSLRHLNQTLTTTCRDASAVVGAAVAAPRSTGTPEQAVKRELGSSSTQQGEQQQQQSQEQQSGPQQDDEEPEMRRVMLIFSDAACMPDRQAIFRLARRYCKDVGFWAPTESKKNGRGYWVVTYPTVAAAQAAEAGLTAEGHRQLQLPARVELRVQRVLATDSRDVKQRARKEQTQ